MTLKERLGHLEGSDTRLCPVGDLLRTLSPDDADALTRVLASKVSTRAIHGELAAEGIQIGRDTLGNHRNGWCRCPKGSDQ
jgi:hypothetical protein